MAGTGNPIGSTAFADFEYNVGVAVDNWTNSTDNTVLLRTINGVQREVPTLNYIATEGANTVSQLQSDGADAIQALRIETPFTFTEGGTLTAPNQAVLYTTNGRYYRWDGSFPKTVTAGTDPTADSTWVDVGQAALRSDLGDGSESGNVVARMPITADSLVDLLNTPFIDGRTYSNNGFYPDSTVGGGTWKAVSGADLTQNNGGTFVSVAALQAWYDAAVAAGGVNTANLQANLSTLFAAGTGTGDAFVRLDTAGCVKVSWFGALEGDYSVSAIKAFEAIGTGADIDFERIRLTPLTRLPLYNKDSFRVINLNLQRDASVSLGDYLMSFEDCSNFTVQGRITGDVDGSTSITTGHLGIKIRGCKNVTYRAYHKNFGDGALGIESSPNNISENININASVFYKCFQTSTNYSGVNSLTYSYCFFKDCGGSAKFATREAKDNLRVKNCVFDNCKEGIRISSYLSMSVVDCYFRNCESGIFIEQNPLATESSDIDSIELSNLIFDGCGSGIRIFNRNISGEIGFIVKNASIKNIRMYNIIGTQSDDAGLLLAENAFENVEIENLSIGSSSADAVVLGYDSTENMSISISHLKILNVSAGKSTLQISAPTSQAYNNIRLESVYIANGGGSSLVRCKKVSIFNHSELAKIGQTAITNCEDVRIERAIFDSSSGFDGVRLDSVGAILKDCEIVSDNNFSLRIESGSSDVELENVALTGTEVYFVVPFRSEYGFGDPNGVVTANIGSTFRRKDGGAGTTFYVKETASGNSGWAAK